MYVNSLIILAFLGVGALVGATLLPKKLLRANSILTTVAVALLLFSMGVGLGGSPTFWQDLTRAGWMGAVMALSTIAGSVLVVWLVGRLVMKGDKQ